MVVNTMSDDEWPVDGETIPQHTLASENIKQEVTPRRWYVYTFCSVLMYLSVLCLLLCVIYSIASIVVDGMFPTEVTVLFIACTIVLILTVVCITLIQRSVVQSFTRQ